MGGRNWLVTFNTSKTKLVSFHQADPTHQSEWMAVFLKWLLALSIYWNSSEFKWNSDTQSIAKDAVKMVSFLYWKYPTLFCHVLLFTRVRKQSIVAMSWLELPNPLPSFDKVEKHLYSFVVDYFPLYLFPIRSNVSTLLLFHRWRIDFKWQRWASIHQCIGYHHEESMWETRKF